MAGLRGRDRQGSAETGRIHVEEERNRSNQKAAEEAGVPESSVQKLRVLHLMNILRIETDPEHGLVVDGDLVYLVDMLHGASSTLPLKS